LPNYIDSAAGVADTANHSFAFQRRKKLMDACRRVKSEVRPDFGDGRRVSIRFNKAAKEVIDFSLPRS
jgi:hypothetical protein